MGIGVVISVLVVVDGAMLDSWARECFFLSLSYGHVIFLASIPNSCKDIPAQAAGRSEFGTQRSYACRRIGLCHSESVDFLKGT